MSRDFHKSCRKDALELFSKDLCFSFDVSVDVDNVPLVVQRFPSVLFWRGISRSSTQFQDTSDLRRGCWASGTLQFLVQPNVPQYIFLTQPMSCQLSVLALLFQQGLKDFTYRNTSYRRCSKSAFLFVALRFGIALDFYFEIPGVFGPILTLLALAIYSPSPSFGELMVRTKAKKGIGTHPSTVRLSHFGLLWTCVEPCFCSVPLFDTQLVSPAWTLMVPLRTLLLYLGTVVLDPLLTSFLS